jgi:hypothetical protein
VTGRLTDSRTVTLDEELPLNSMKVRLIIEPVAPLAKQPYLEVMADIRRRQQARGYEPSSPDDIARYLKEERESWEE